MVDYTRREVLDIVFLVVYVVLTVGIFGLFVGFGLGGFERQEVLEKNNFYIPYGVGFLIGVLALKIGGLFLFGKKKANYEGAILHDPEQTPFGVFKSLSNPIVLLLAMLIVFTIAGYFATSSQTFFSEIPRYEQQFTPTADVFFSVYPAAPSETLGAIFLISLFGFIWGFVALKYRIPFIVFFLVLLIVGTLISMGYGYVNHIARYSDSEIKMRNVLWFWGFGGFLTSLTGSVIPFLVLHDLNNFFYKLSEVFNSDVAQFLVLSMIALEVVLFIFILTKFVWGKNRKKT